MKDYIEISEINKMILRKGDSNKHRDKEVHIGKLKIEICDHIH